MQLTLLLLSRQTSSDCASAAGKTETDVFKPNSVTNEFQMLLK